MSSFVLVVDDDPMLLDVAASMLEELGCTVLVTHCGEDALRVLNREPRISVMLTDVQMPGMDGIELAARARRIRNDLRIVFSSGRAAIDNEPFLSKPFSREELSRLVHC